MASHLEGEDYELPVAGGSTHQTTLGASKLCWRPDVLGSQVMMIFVDEISKNVISG